MHLIFADRDEAGRRLAKKLHQFHGTDSIILAIPRGGVPVAVAVAHKLQLPWNVLVAKKLPIPWNPEAGFGAVTADGSIVLNEAMIAGLQLNSKQIDTVVNKIKDEVIKRTETYSKERPLPDIKGKSVIILDDGLASGYTMLAAIKSIRSHSPSKVIVAAPIASRSSAQLVKEAGDECIFEIVSASIPFAVADYYLAWHDLTEDEVIPLLRSE